MIHDVRSIGGQLSIEHRVLLLPPPMRLMHNPVRCIVQFKSEYVTIVYSLATRVLISIEAYPCERSIIFSSVDIVHDVLLLSSPFDRW